VIGRKNARALARLGTLIRRCIQCSKELQTCYEHWLRRQIEIIDPRVIVLLGKIPVSQLLHVTRSLQELHGRFYRQAGRLSIKSSIIRRQECALPI
jgi:uracil-DNA glycosylase family 4